MGLNEDVMAYATELAEAAGITDATAREAFLKNDKVQGKLRAKFEDVTREKGRAEAESKKAKDAETRMNTYYTEGLDLANRNKAAVDAANADVARYVAAYGELPGGGDPNNPGARRAAVQDVIDKKTFDERIGLTEANTVGLLTTAVKLLDQHRREFPNEPFDVDAIVKTATEKKLTANQAYAEMMGPKREAASAAARAAETKAAVDAALMEDRSKRAASTTVDAGARSEFLTNAIKSTNAPTTAKESFRQGWTEPNASAQMEKEFGRKH